MTTFVLSRTAAAAVTSSRQGEPGHVCWNGFKAQPLSPRAANDNETVRSLSQGQG